MKTSHCSRSIMAMIACAAGLAACSGKPSAAASTPDSTKAAAGQLAKPAEPTETAAASDSTAKSRMFAGADDTTKAKLLPMRNLQDASSYAATIRAGRKAMATWPMGPAPLPGSILPAKRIVAFYGNPLEKRMGVLGEYPVDQMLAKLDSQVAEWKKADPSTPVQPALHLVAVTAQGAPGRDGGYRLRMDTALIEKVYSWAQRKNALLFLDIQVGHSTVQAELPRLLPFLARPNVHFAIDPEFSMHYKKEGIVPSKKIGQSDAEEINYAIRTLSQLVADKKIPPKILVVHRWTKAMVSNASQIKLDRNVQVVMDMDGWGPPWLKFDSYRDYEVAEPVQFTGFKIFYHHDTRKESSVLTPLEVLRLLPRPMYIQYQ